MLKPIISNMDFIVPNIRERGHPDEWHGSTKPSVRSVIVKYV